MLAQLNKDLGQIKLDPVLDFMISASFPENLTMETCLAIQQILLVLSLSMSNTEDLKLVDSWMVKTAQKIKNFENNQSEVQYIC